MMSEGKAKFSLLKDRIVVPENVSADFLSEVLITLLLKKACNSKSAWAKWIILAALEELGGREAPLLSVESVAALQKGCFSPLSRVNPVFGQKIIPTRVEKDEEENQAKKMKISFDEDSEKDNCKNISTELSEGSLTGEVPKAMDCNNYVSVGVQCSMEENSDALNTDMLGKIREAVQMVDKETQWTPGWQCVPLEENPILKRERSEPVSAVKFNEKKMPTFYGKLLITKRSTVPSKVIPLEPLFQLSDPRQAVRDAAGEQELPLDHQTAFEHTLESPPDSFNQIGNNILVIDNNSSSCNSDDSLLSSSKFECPEKNSTSEPTPFPPPSTQYTPKFNSYKAYNKDFINPHFKHHQMIENDFAICKRGRFPYPDAIINSRGNEPYSPTYSGFDSANVSPVDMELSDL